MITFPVTPWGKGDKRTGGPMHISFRGRRHALLGAVAVSSLALAAGAQPAQAQSVKEPQIAINDGVPPEDIVDTVDVNGIGQIVTDNGDGTVGLCTATLISPRTVIFAAHCVNDEGAGDYGAANGGKPIGIGFQADTINGIISWLTNGYQTDRANYFYNINHIAYNPRSLDPGPGLNFLQGDVAIGALDTPATNVPTWTTLLAPLPNPAGGEDVNGTGYHVTITGYGNQGNGTLGATQGIDFRRRTAENMLGLLGSLNDVDDFLFGSNQGFAQNLYMVDFDDPTGASPYDYNFLRDEPTPNEGITGGGDSGGPLIIDQAFGDTKTVIGVLSGGSRYFLGQPSGGYGTTAFYQPLYLFWQWIAENNPYRYVSSVAGDGNWTDADHWVTDLDPAYMVIDADGNLVNGLPTTAEAGVGGTSPKFGNICVEYPGVSDCLDLATGTEVVNGNVVGGASAAGPGISNGKATVDIAALDRAAQASGASGAAETAVAAASAAALPDPTLANGLPGATGFVPDNSDGDASTGSRPYYFDVTLAADGTTTLDTGVAIDRLTVAGANSALDITDQGFLLSLIDATQFGGHVNVDGDLFTPGDYALIGGLLSGKGAITTPYLTSVAGTIAPGGLGTAGTLTVNGNLILSSGNVLAIDLGENESDVLAVKAIPGTAITGEANVGGMIVFTPVEGYRPRDGDTATFLTAEGGVTGAFDAGNSLSAILYPQLSYAANAVSVEIEARAYIDVIDTSSPVQRSYAHLLDRSRVNYDGMATLYGELDLLDLDTLEATLEAMAPRTEQTRTSLGKLATESLSRLYRDRIALGRGGATAGTLAMIGQPLQLASLATRDMPFGTRQASDTGAPLVTSDVRLPANVSAYIAGGYLDGDARPMATALDTGRDQLDGWYVAAGIEVMPDDDSLVGFSFAYADTEGQTGAPQTAKGTLYQGTLYGAFELGKLMVSSQASAGLFETATTRRFTAGTTDYGLNQHDRSLALASEVNVGTDLGTPGGLSITPTAGLRYAYLDFSKAKETGGDAALAVDRTGYTSLQGRAGVDIGGATDGITPRVHAAYVHEFEDPAFLYNAMFVNGAGAPAPFALAGTDRNWGEIGGALRYDSGDIVIDVGVDTTFERADLDYQTYRGSITIRF